MSLKVQPLLNSSRCGWNRIEARARLAIEAKVETIDGCNPAFILNISCHGAMLHVEESLNQDTELVLKCGPVDAFGKVAWARDGRVGVEFDEAIPEEVVIDLRRLADDIARYATPNTNSRPGLSTRPLTREEQDVAGEWATSSRIR